MCFTGINLKHAALLAPVLALFLPPAAAAPLSPGAGVIPLSLTRVLSRRWDKLPTDQKLHHHLRRAYVTQAFASGIDFHSEAVLTPDQVASLLNSSYHKAVEDNSSLATINGGTGDGAVRAGDGTGITVKIFLGDSDGGVGRKDPNEAFEPEIYHLGYVTQVFLGTPQRPFNVVVDSGSSDFWVGHEYCENSDDGGPCGEHNFLGPTTSSSYTDSSIKFDVKYGPSAARGILAKDNLGFADFCVEDFALGVASHVPDFVAGDINIDGILGTASSKLSQLGLKTPVEVLHEKGLLREPIVAYQMNRHGNDGKITFGGIGQMLVDWDSLVTVDNISPKGYWEAKMDVKLDSEEFTLAGRSGVIDTGAAVILAPPTDARAVHATIPGARHDAKYGYVVPCNAKTVIALSFEGQVFDIDPRDLSFLPLGKGECVSAIQEGRLFNETQWLVGDVFLKNVLFVHDISKNTMQFAKLATP